MKKIKCVYIIILSSLLLSACNGRVESTPISEEELINENLRLKDQVADLKMELQQLEKHYTKERELKNQILTFFYEFKEGNLDTIQSMVAEDVEVTSDALKYKNGWETTIPLDKYSGILFKEVDWVSDELVCVHMEFLKQKGVEPLKIYMIRDDYSWKIRSIALSYVIVDKEKN